MNAAFRSPVIPAALERQDTPRKPWWTTLDWSAVDAGIRQDIADMNLKPGIVLEFRQPDRSAYDAWR
jgi:hypothetical protein